MDRSFLIVDGNNVIHSWSDLCSLHHARKGEAHRELIRRLETYQNLGKHRVVLVFDGRGRSTTETREPGSIQVIYSSSGTPADFLIERLALAYAGEFRIVVASDDGAIRNSVGQAGGEVMSTKLLRDEVDLANREVIRWIRNGHDSSKKRKNF